MLQRLLFATHPPTYRAFDRLRLRLRPLYESDRQKHQRERQTADYLLLSLTNCGRTWLRVILGRAMQLHCGDENIDQNINLHDLFRFSEAVPTLPAIKPMHEKYGQFGNRYTGQKVILLVRDPRDAVVSRYHQHKADLAFDSLEHYVKAGPDLAAYIQFYNDWQTHRDSAEDLLLVRYEDMQADTYAEVTRIVEFLQLPVLAVHLRQAIAHASFKDLQKMEVIGDRQVRTAVMSARDPHQPDSFKVRRGAIGGYRSELTSEGVALVDDIVQTQLNPVYGY